MLTISRPYTEQLFILTVQTGGALLIGWHVQNTWFRLCLDDVADGSY